MVPEHARHRRPSLVPALILLLLGAAYRIFWLLHRPLMFGAEEARRAAVSVARTGEIADVFALGGGLSAHLTPLMPYIAGGVYHVFGIQTPLSEGILAGLSIGFVLGTALVYYLVFSITGSPRSGALAALAGLCLLPIFTDLEAVQFRVWEGGLASLIAAAQLLVVVRSDKPHGPGWSTIVALSLLSALTIFVSPPLGLAAYAAFGILILRRIAPARWIGIGLIAVLVLVAVLTPWTIRNYVDFGRIIPFRGNLGLEIALGNNDATVSGRNEAQTFSSLANAIHPDNSQGFARMEAAGGAIPYSDRLQRQTERWIESHPGGFAVLALRHAREFYFPPAWQFLSKESKALARARQVVIWIVSFLGLVSVVVFLIRRNWMMSYPAVYAILPMFPYVLVQPWPRYFYVVYPALMYFAAELVALVCSRRSESR